MAPSFLPDVRVAVDELEQAMRAAARTANQREYRRLAASIPSATEWSRTESIGRGVSNYYAGITDRRATALGLALRCYACEHGGRMPERVIDLVPRYIPAVPRDPLDAENEPFRFRRGTDGSAGPIIYSVGMDGCDDGGNEDVRPSYRGDSAEPTRWDRNDFVLHLARQPRPPRKPFDWDNPPWLLGRPMPAPAAGMIEEEMGPRPPPSVRK